MSLKCIAFLTTAVLNSCSQPLPPLWEQIDLEPEMLVYLGQTRNTFPCETLHLQWA